MITPNSCANPVDFSSRTRNKILEPKLSGAKTKHNETSQQPPDLSETAKNFQTLLLPSLRYKEYTFGNIKGKK